MTTPHLANSRYLAGIQCLRRLWLQVHEPDEQEAPAPGSPIEVGMEIGRKAQLLFPGGVLIEEAPWEHAEAVACTAALMQDASVPAIFEAGFAYGDVRVRVDILERRPEGWGLLEVKGSTRVKDHHLDDVALQAYVLAAAGVDLRAIEIVHVNNTYVRGSDGIDWTAFFARVDVSDAVATLIAEIPQRLPVMRDSLALGTQPHVQPGKQCNTPYGCQFWDRCTADKPADWVFYLPRLKPAQAERLDALGITAISAIPAEFPLAGKQAIIRDAIISGLPYLAPDLRRLLHQFGPPACYLDFEAMMPPIPLYELTRPYQTLPFQWSLHTVSADGVLSHQEFLADIGDDPRRAFAETLVDALEGLDLPIIVYSAYERTRLNELATQFPDLARPIGAIVDRLADLLPVVRGAVYLPAFDFSHSIKSVAPALSPGFGYDDLADIADGMAAASTFAQMASGAIHDPADIAKFRQALLAYCERDTLAMVEVHRALIALA
jgi:predicted RecB family nuclease